MPLNTYIFVNKDQSKIQKQKTTARTHSKKQWKSVYKKL